MSSKALKTNEEDLRIVMVGKSGAGKSATGNTILGRVAFKSEFAFESKSLTMDCQEARGLVDGRNISVVDTPGIFDPRFGDDKVMNDIKQCICFSAPGPHVFLIVIKLGRFTQEDQTSVEMIQMAFGDMSNKYTMILLTGGDLLNAYPVEDFVKKSPKLQAVISKYDGRYHVFNNETKDPSQVTELLAKIESMVEVNGRSHYTTEMFQEAEIEQRRIIEEDEKKRVEEYLREISLEESRREAEEGNSFLSKAGIRAKAGAAKRVVANAFDVVVKPTTTIGVGIKKCTIQ